MHMNPCISLGRYGGSLFQTYVSVSWPGGPDPTSNAACFLVPDVDARGNTVTHGFILVSAVGPYVQQGKFSIVVYLWMCSVY